MKFYKTILVLGLVVGDYGVSGCDLRTQQEFEKICLSGGHTQASCDCIYQRLEQVYSPQLMQRLEHVSLQSPALPQDFAPTFFSVMRRCYKNDMG
ncbi:MULTISPECIES: hypothetical protein [Acinetobacter calcoaceticus/baumannii complex]|uniref:Uncharacterized protein n=1 Tax=Acinetobacter nosocomialis 28F TaxID=1147131 RepID=A0AA36NZI3_ACINO|nr:MULTISPECIES: hypothetical protein [Acinetobacter calcoaceticus/baumannii complex]EXE99143.1 hypothetical protein J594_1998 [Acinetobacter sp. 259052]EYT20950.1 hypothetical protein J595_00370 [Acinetobacter sp. 1592897]KRJ14322.1 hypothetical protein APC77_06515 [Acinetobacter nosocomialis]MBR7698861.1 hypothetical protein [Acinetobacter nosocomialis]OUR05567.1 hypothetical protein B4R78_17285 [Acinetobacter nosocomialis]